MHTNHEEAEALTAAELVRLRALLVRTREALLARHRRLVAEAAVHEEVQDEGDDAASSEGQHTRVGLAQVDDGLLGRVEAALRRMEAGTYGVDEDTGEPIGVRRLMVVPWATRTVVQQEKREAARAA